MRVVLVRGFAVPGVVLGPLARRLRGEGHEVAIAPLALNVDCGERAVPWTAIWSSADRISGDLGRPPPAARALDVGTGHLGALRSPAIAEALRG